jgi:SAM-dependent methyltransferase
MNYNQKRAQAMTRFRRGQPAEAVRLFAEALAEKETSEGWNDWATAQVAAGAGEEAEAGYERALELNPNDQEALVNLAVLRVAKSRFAEALALLDRAQPIALQPATIQKLIAQCRQQALPEQDAPRLEEYLRRFVDKNELPAGFDAHVESYVAALQFLPQAAPEQRLLELGARFHPVPVSLKKIKGYGVVCARFGNEPDKLEWRLTDTAGSEEHNFPVYDFDFEFAPWPFEDASFDVVLASQVLERLARDPMLVLQEINRVLKSDGLLLLVAANLASARSIAKALRGDSPYQFGHYVTGGDSHDRHHREYTPGELERVLVCAGFGDLHLQTHNRRGLAPEPDILRSLLALKVPIARRGDDILVLARKQAAVQERYPAELYRISEVCPRTDPAVSSKPGSPGLGLPQENRTVTSTVDATAPGSEKILIVSQSIFCTDGTGEDMWLSQVLRILRNLGHQVTYAACADPDGRELDPVFAALGIEVCAGMAASADGFANVLRRGRFDIAILVHDFTSGISVPERYLDEICRESPATKIVVLCNDCFSRRERRRAELTGLLTDEERAAGLEQRERECFRAADLVLTVSEDTRRALQELDPTLAIEFFPIPAATLPSTQGWNDRRDLLLLADPGDPADPDFQWFRTEIWPRVRRALPGVRLHVAGVDLPESAAVTRTEGIVGLGQIPEPAVALSRYRILVSPLRLAIRKREVLMALASGTPVVTTSIGAEGLEVTDGDQVLVADSAAKFLAAVARVYNDAELWQKLVDNGRNHVEQTFSPQRARQRMANALQVLRGIQPRTVAGELRWSAREVEKFAPRIMDGCRHTPMQLVVLRMQAYAEYAEHLLVQHRPVEACEQLRHIFACIRGPLPRHHFFANVLTLLERCYRALDKAERAVRCGHEAILFLPEFNLKPATAVAGAGPVRGKAPVPGLKTPLPAPAMQPPLEL